MKTARNLLLIAFVFAAGFAQSVKGQDRTVINEAQKITNDRFTVSLTTPRGARVYAVNRPNARMLKAIDDGLANLFALSRKNNYSRRLNYSDYTIFIAKADRLKDSSGQYSPDIAIGAAQYAGSIFDQGGYIYAAGMVVAFNPNAFIIAEHTKHYERVSDVVRYEGEHLVLYHNDRRLFNQTADHSQGGGHPILQ
ncbi:MAG: hypothetical protein JWN60_1873 [Acidobacteria bacterium]|jgi:hypothetical protein|nr:hypothetical protein [Acidobacteriota bacterium]